MAEMRIYYSNKYNYTINDNLKKRYNRALMIYILYDPKYHPLLTLFDPTIYQRLKFIFVQFSFFRKLFKIELYTIHYLNILINKLNKS